MLDFKGDPILTISARLDTLTRQFIIRSGPSLRGSPEVARIKSHLMSIGLDLEVVFINSLDGGSLTLIVKGDKLKRYAVVARLDSYLTEDVLDAQKLRNDSRWRACRSRSSSLGEQRNISGRYRDLFRQDCRRRQVFCLGLSTEMTEEYLLSILAVDVALMSAIVACMEQRHPWVGPGS